MFAISVNRFSVAAKNSSSDLESHIGMPLRGEDRETDNEEAIPSNLARRSRNADAPQDAPWDLGFVDLDFPQKKMHRRACMTKPKQDLPVYSQVYRCPGSEMFLVLRPLYRPP